MIKKIQASNSDAVRYKYYWR